jgi:hypothetical protein
MFIIIYNFNFMFKFSIIVVCTFFFFFSILGYAEYLTCSILLYQSSLLNHVLHCRRSELRPADEKSNQAELYHTALCFWLCIESLLYRKLHIDCRQNMLYALFMILLHFPIGHICAQNIVGCRLITR